MRFSVTIDADAVAEVERHRLTPPSAGSGRRRAPATGLGVSMGLAGAMGRAWLRRASTSFSLFGGGLGARDGGARMALPVASDGPAARRRLGALGRARSAGTAGGTMRKLPVPVCVTVPARLRAGACRRACARPLWPKRPRSACRSDAPSRLRDDVAVEAEADGPALLADDDDDRVGLLGDAERGAVARAERLVEDLRVGHREEDAGLGDAQVADDDGAVVQLVQALGHEQADEQLALHRRVDRRALPHDELVEVRVLLEAMSAPMRWRASSVAAATTSSMTLRLLLRARCPPKNARAPTRMRPRRMSFWKTTTTMRMIDERSAMSRLRG